MGFVKLQGVENIAAGEAGSAAEVELGNIGEEGFVSIVVGAGMRTAVREVESTAVNTEHIGVVVVNIGEWEAASSVAGEEVVNIVGEAVVSIVGEMGVGIVGEEVVNIAGEAVVNMVAGEVVVNTVEGGVVNTGARVEGAEWRGVARCRGTEHNSAVGDEKQRPSGWEVAGR
jgi:hypothetical protein